MYDSDRQRGGEAKEDRRLGVAWLVVSQGRWTVIAGLAAVEDGVGGGMNSVTVEVASSHRFRRSEAVQGRFG